MKSPGGTAISERLLQLQVLVGCRSLGGAKQSNFDGRVKPCNGEYLANTLAKSVWDSCQIRVKVHQGWHVSDVIIKYE